MNETPLEAPVEAQYATATEDTAPEPPARRRRRPRRKATPPSGTATLADIAAGYLAHMETEGKSDGTISSYRMELRTAAIELGEDTRSPTSRPRRSTPSSLRSA
jgi:hypothetical protein